MTPHVSPERPEDSSLWVAGGIASPERWEDLRRRCDESLDRAKGLRIRSPEEAHDAWEAWDEVRLLPQEADAVGKALLPTLLETVKRQRGEWSKAPPTKPGWWWFRTIESLEGKRSKPSVLRVAFQRGQLYGLSGSEPWLVVQKGYIEWWSVPVNEPGEGEAE